MSETPEPVQVSAGDARRMVREALFPTMLTLVGQPGMDNMAKSFRLKSTAELFRMYATVLDSAAEIYDNGTQDTAKVTMPEFTSPDLGVTVPDTVPSEWQAPDDGTDKPQT